MHILQHLFFIVGEQCLLILKICISPILLNKIQLTMEFWVVQAQMTSVLIEFLKQ